MGHTNGSQYPCLWKPPIERWGRIPRRCVAAGALGVVGDISRLSTHPPQLDKVIRELKNEKVRMKNYYDTLEDIESLIKTESGALIKRVMHKRPVRAMVLNPGNFTSNDVTGESTGKVVCGLWVFGYLCLTPPLPLQVGAPSALSPTTTTFLCLTFTLARRCARSVVTARTCTRRRTLGTLVPSLACMWWSVEQRRAAPPC